MFLGILIGMLIFGLLVIVLNNDRGIHDPARTHRGIARLIGTGFACVGLFGAIGWILEVNL